MKFLMMRRQILLGLAVAVSLSAATTLAVADKPGTPNLESKPKPGSKSAEESNRYELATFGGGCFWCTEAVFRELKGVRAVVSGYSGGKFRAPSYKAVLTGYTGHAEVVQITYDPDVISYTDLLEVFWKTHDPTTPNRQGIDVGTQYRSVIFYHNERQQELAKHYKEKLDKSRAFPKPIVTRITQFTTFYRAEIYHQNFYQRNRFDRYCRRVIRPKLAKFRRVFRDKLKTAE